MPKPSYDGTKPDYNKNTGTEKSRRLTRDLNGLQHDIREDFGQRISDLSTLMHKFKTLMASDIKLLRKSDHQSVQNIPVLTKIIRSEDKPEDPQNENAADTPPIAAEKVEFSLLQETARFETGLYHLNSQLYRFRLELDQELEFREEALHTHFRHQSDLAKVLHQLTRKMQEERNTRN